MKWPGNANLRGNFHLFVSRTRYSQVPLEKNIKDLSDEKDCSDNKKSVLYHGFSEVDVEILGAILKPIDRIASF